MNLIKNDVDFLTECGFSENDVFLKIRGKKTIRTK